MNDFQPPDDGPRFEIRAGRRSRYRITTTGQWTLLMTQLSDAGYRTYTLLLAHVNAERDDTDVWPRQKTLADMLGKQPNAVSRVITKELAPLGLVDVTTLRYGTNNSRRRNVYTVHEEPPPGWSGYASLKEWYAAQNGKTAGQTGDTKNRVSEDTTNRSSEDTEKEVENYTKVELEEASKSVVPAVGRSPQDGSSGGSTPTAEQQDPAPSTKRPMHPGIQAVALAVPEMWALIKPQQRGVASLSVRTFLKNTGLSPEDAADLVARRWSADEGKVRDPLGWLKARGLRIEEEVPEHIREERRHQRTAAVIRAREEMPDATPEARRDAAGTWVHQLVQLQKKTALEAAPVADWKCTQCYVSKTGDRPDHGLCNTCWGETPEGAFAQLAQRLDPPF